MSTVTLKTGNKTKKIQLMGSLGGKPEGNALFVASVTDVPENHIISVIALNVTTELVEEVEE